MLAVFLPIFAGVTKIVFANNFRAPLIVEVSVLKFLTSNYETSVMELFSKNSF